MSAAFKFLQKWAYRLAQADMVFWIMPLLIALLVAGTIAQRWMGLWPAIDLFFGGFVLWPKIFSIPLPLPGAYTLLGILSINLTLKFLLGSEWTWRKSGIILTHLGALILLFGGLITAIDAHETYMLIPEGAETPYIYSYSQRELVIYEGETALVKRTFKTVDDWNFSTLPFDIAIRSSCENCKILKRVDTPEYDENLQYQAMARFMAFKPKALDPQPETNLTGIEFTLSGTDQDGLYIAFDGMPQPIEITKDDRNFTLVFGKAQSRLPFSIALNDFQKQQYGGTNIAQSYSSDIVVKDGGLEWPARIEMNEPLRYRGYTFFQSSFEETPGGEATILAVVENKGWLFPYIGTIIIGLGLLLHIALIFSANRKQAAP